MIYEAIQNFAKKYKKLIIYSILIYGIYILKSRIYDKFIPITRVLTDIKNGSYASLVIGTFLVIAYKK